MGVGREDKGYELDTLSCGTPSHPKILHFIRPLALHQDLLFHHTLRLMILNVTQGICLIHLTVFDLILLFMVLLVAKLIGLNHAPILLNDG